MQIGMRSQEHLLHVPSFVDVFPTLLSLVPISPTKHSAQKVRGRKAKVEGAGPSMSEDCVAEEYKWANGNNGGSALFGPAIMSGNKAAGLIKLFTESCADPFKLEYAHANPWVAKKDNKGKKDRPAGEKARPHLDCTKAQ